MYTSACIGLKINVYIYIHRCTHHEMCPINQVCVPAGRHHACMYLCVCMYACVMCVCVCACVSVFGCSLLVGLFQAQDSPKGLY